MSLEINIKKRLGNFTLSVCLNTEDETVGLLGSSGCGKSMTLRCIAGIETPDEGYIRINGKTCYDSKKHINLPPQKRHVGMLFQNYALFPNMTLEENILCGFAKNTQNKKERLEALLDQFQLQELRNQHPGQLSGGQQQRAALARCLASEPQIILLDEPFSALDSALKALLQISLKEQLAAFKGSVILVTHDRDEAYLLSDRIAIMNQGSILKIDSKEELFKDPGCSAAARLIGCKNVISARKTGEHSLHIPDWDASLSLERSVPDGLTAIGIRAHDFLPVDQSDINCIPVKLSQLTEYPFSYNGIFQTRGEGKIFWILNKETLEPDHVLEIPSIFHVPEDRVLLLCD